MLDDDADMEMEATTEPVEDAADQEIDAMEIAVGPFIALH